MCILTHKITHGFDSIYEELYLIQYILKISYICLKIIQNFKKAKYIYLFINSAFKNGKNES